MALCVHPVAFYKCARIFMLLFTGDVPTKILKMAQQAAETPLDQAGFSTGGDFEQ